MANRLAQMKKQDQQRSLRERSPSLFTFNTKLFNDPSRLYSFKRFLQKELADENLLYYLDVQEWDGLKTDRAKLHKAGEIVEKYVAVGCPTPINIESRELNNIRSTWAQRNEKPISDIFKNSKAEIYKMLKLDSYTRFCRSMFFEAMTKGYQMKDVTFPEEIFMKFIELATGSGLDWKEVSTKKDIELYHAVQQPNTHLLKSKTVIPGDTKRVLAYLRDVSNAPDWDTDMVDSKVVERFSEFFEVVYLAYKGSFLGDTKRDFCLGQVCREFSDGTCALIRRSLPDDDLVPPEKGFARTEVETSGFLLECIPDKPLYCTITMINQIVYDGKAGKKALAGQKSRSVALASLKSMLVKDPELLDQFDSV